MLLQREVCKLFLIEEKQRRNCDPWLPAMRPLLADSSIVKMKLYIIHSAVKKIINELLIPK